MAVSGHGLMKCQNGREAGMDKKKLSLMTFPMEMDYASRAMTVEDTFRQAAWAGINYVDVMNVREKDRKKYQDAGRNTGVQVYCYICSVSFFAEKEKILAELEGQLETAKALGAKYLMIVPYRFGGDLKKAGQLGRKRTRELMEERFAAAVEMGEKYEIAVCFETTPHDVLCLSGNEDCKYILERTPGLGLVLDSANMLPHGDTTMEAYEMLKEYIVHVHLKDIRPVKKGLLSIGAEYMKDGRVMKACVWGEGIIPVEQLYERMLCDGYQGLFALEYVHPAKLRCGPREHHMQLEKFLGKGRE